MAASKAGMPSNLTAATDGAARTETIPAEKKKSKWVTSADDMQSWYNNEDGSYTEFGKNTVEPYVDTSKKMAEGMTEPLGAGGVTLADTIKEANLGNDFQTAGIGGADKSTESTETETANPTTTASNKAETVVEETAGANPQETKRYTNSMMGIWDAFREGKIDQGTALYFTLDSIAKLARNTGKDLNNIAAAFTGGTTDNEREDSLWGQRRGKMFENELAGEVESQYGSPAWRAKQHDLNSLSMEDKDLVAKDISNWIAQNSKGLTVNALAEQLRAMGISNDVTEAMNWLKIDLGNKAKAGDKNAMAILSTLDGLNTVAEPVTNAVAKLAK